MNRTLAPSAGRPREYLDARGFQTYRDADAKPMTAAVRKIGNVEQRVLALHG